MTETAFDITPYLHRSEGAHFDRKSLWQGLPRAKRPRNRKTVRGQVAAYVAAFANAEGGVLLLGVEDDGTVSGHGYPASVVDVMLRVPADRLQPPQRVGFRAEISGQEVLVFNVAMAFAPVQVVGDGYPLRMGDQTVQAGFEQIQAMKLYGLVESFEARPSARGLADLDESLLARARTAGGLADLSNTDYLLQRRLADWRGASLVLRQAAELLFCTGLPEHPNAGIRVFRVIGTERRTGLDHNVEELPRIEGALPRVLTTVYNIVAGLLRRPSRLGPGGLFRQRTEYPEFSWKEAILNAVAHRDYTSHGRCVEVWFYDDRMEVVSPGGLPPAIDLARLLALEPSHESRNPRIVRGLVDLGLMRDQGEGIPRMFAEMEGNFLPKPELSVDAYQVRLVLGNTLTLTAADRAFVGRLANEELSELEFRSLLEARRHGQIDNARMRSVAGLDTLAASLILRRLRDRGLLMLHSAGSASYYTLGEHLLVDPSPSLLESTQLSGESTQLGGESTQLGAESTQLERAGVPASAHSQELSPSHAVPAALHREIANLGKKPKSSELRHVILRLCEAAPRDVATLAGILGRNPKALKRHIQAMLKDGELRPRFPDRPTHPQQAYLAAQRPLLGTRDE